MMGVGEKERESEAYRCRCVGKQHEEQKCGRLVMGGCGKLERGRRWRGGVRVEVDENGEVELKRSGWKRKGMDVTPILMVESALRDEGDEDSYIS